MNEGHFAEGLPGGELINFDFLEHFIVVEIAKRSFDEVSFLLVGVYGNLSFQNHIKVPPRLRDVDDIFVGLEFLVI